MATTDRAGNAYGTPAKSATNAQRGAYNRDAAGGGTVNRFSAQTRKAAPLSNEAYNSSIKQGVAPNAAQGSQTQMNVKNDSGSGYGATMGNVKSNYKAARQQGMSPDDARGSALGNAGATMSRDAQGNPVR